MHACRKALSDGRWHFQHGPIDLIIQAHGQADAVARAHDNAWSRFAGVLQELVDELPALRTPIRLADSCTLRGAVARRMWAACAPFRTNFVTPMASVAGSVAQEILQCYVHQGIDRAWVNNGGDIALHLADGQEAVVGVVADVAALRRAPVQPAGWLLDGQIRIASTMPVRGVATSGWRGRSQSLGIADSVTVLAGTAAQADAAATVVANAVNLQDDRIHRLPARQVRDDSDLGTLAVTVDVPVLPPEAVHLALQNGLHKAHQLQSQGLLWFALLTCQGQHAATAQAPGAHLPPGAKISMHEPVAGSVFA